MKNKSESSSDSQNTDTSESLTTPRRSTLKRLATSGAVAGAFAAMPARWTRPVVESVALPAHAQTSPGDIEDGDFFFVDVAFNRHTPGWLNWLIPSAYAQGSEQCFLCGACARISNGQITFRLLATLPETNTLIACYEGSGNIGDTVNLGVVSGSALDCGVPAITFVSVDGNAPNRTFVVAAAGDQEMLLEDPSRTCSCGALSCEDVLENCLLHGTPVLLPDGGFRRIETLAVGDIVAALDHDAGGTKPAVVTKLVTDHMRGEYWRINDALLITNDHPVLAAEESGIAWRRVDDLAEGMEIQGVHGRTTIVSLERVSEPARTVYMETTADNFIATPAGVAYVVKAGYGTTFQRRRAEKRSAVHA